MRAMLATLALLTLIAPAQASEVRNYFTPQRDGHRINACLATGACGKPAADAFCQAEGYDQAMLFQRELDNFDGAVDTGTKTAWSGKEELQGALGGILFSHRQCPLGKVSASAKTFPLLRVPLWTDKDLSETRLGETK